MDKNHSVEMTPLFPEKSLPLLVKPAVDDMDFLVWAENHQPLLESKLLRHGALLFRGFNVTQPSDLEHFALKMSGSLLEYRERSSPRHTVSGNIYTSTDYPPHQNIFPHCENSYQFTWPMKLFFQCRVAPSEGGATPIADCRKVLNRIPASIQRRFEEKGVRYIRNFSEELGLTWQTVFQTESREEVEAYCNQNGIRAQWKEDGGLRTISVRPAILQHPKTREWTWFNHAAFFHVTTLDPELSEVLMATYDEEDLPSQTSYGDGTAIPLAELDLIRDAYRCESVSFAWQRGDLLMVDNMLASHSRTPFKGERKILVAMAEPMDRHQFPAVGAGERLHS